MLTKYDIELVEVASLSTSTVNSNEKNISEDKSADTASLEALFK